MSVSEERKGNNHVGPFPSLELGGPPRPNADHGW